MGELQELQPRRHCLRRALAVVRSHYHAINLRVIGVGFARGMGVTKQEQLKDEVEDVVKKLAGDVDLFGEVDGEGQAQ